MAKNFNSVSFTVLLLVLLMVSTEIPKSEAQQCSGTPCKFLGECGLDPYTGSGADCLACCKDRYGSTIVCKGLVEGTPKHCHCYGF